MLTKTKYTAQFVATCLFVTFLAVACGGDVEIPPDIEATVEARVKNELSLEATIEARALELARKLEEETTQAVPTSTPTALPTSTPIPLPTATVVPPTATVVPPTPTVVPPTAIPMKDYSQVATELRPSVVRIERVNGSAGTGFVIDSYGTIVTNAHVVGDDWWVTVTLSDGTTRTAFVLGRTVAEDLALLKIDGYKMSSVDLSSSRRPLVGEEVLAMGYPLNLPGAATLTKGMVSAFRPKTFGSLSALQTDTAMNPGNSGGPLVDLDGLLVGINASGYADAEGINFAISIDEASPILETLSYGELGKSDGEFVSRYHPFTVTVPEGWVVYETGPSVWTNNLAALYMRNQDSSGTVLIVLEELSEGTTTDQFADLKTELGSVPEDFDQYEKTATREVTLSALPAREVVETVKLKENDFYQNAASYFLTSAGMGYSIYGSSEITEWADFTDDLTRILDSFVITSGNFASSSTASQTAAIGSTASAILPSNSVDFGPVDGILNHDSDAMTIPAYKSSVALRNTAVDATFIPPHYDSSRRWSSGFMLRRTINGSQHMVVIDSNRHWYHYVRIGTANAERIAYKESLHIAVGQGSTNHVRVMAVDDRGWLFINGNYVAELDLSGWLEAGDVKVIGPIFKGQQSSGEFTEFKDFRVSSLQLVFGPAAGSIEHVPGRISNKRSKVVLADGIFEVQINNPFAVNEGSWSPGIFIRNSKPNALHRVGIASDSNWYHMLNTGTTSSNTLLIRSYSPQIDTSPTGNNLLRLIVLGNEGWVFINNTYVAKVDLSGWYQGGKVGVHDNVWAGHGIEGKPTIFSRFAVWSIGKGWEAQ